MREAIRDLTRSLGSGFGRRAIFWREAYSGMPRGMDLPKTKSMEGIPFQAVRRNVIMKSADRLDPGSANGLAPSDNSGILIFPAIPGFIDRELSSLLVLNPSSPIAGDSP